MSAETVPAPKKKSPRWKGWARDLVLFALLFTAVGMFQARNLIPTGEPFPMQEAALYNGGSITMEDLKGKTTLMVVWAPWCGVCGAASDNVSRVQKWLGDRVQIYSVAMDYQTEDAVQKFIDKHKVDYPVILVDDKLAKDLQVRAFPTLYVLNKEGRVKHRASGYTTTFGMLWRALI